MKNYLLVAFQLIVTLAYSQKQHVNEDFNNSALPLNWTNDSVSGSHFWFFGVDGANLHSGNQNIDGTPMAFFDDDVLGYISDNNTAELTTPTFDNSTALYTYLSFDYNFRQIPGSILDSFYVDIYDGSRWQRVFSRDQDDCGNYTICSTFPSVFIDISAYTATNCQVRFTYHDGNGWGYYVGLDNVKIWSPYANDLIAAEIIEPKTGCNLSSTDSIKVLIKNLGHQTQQNFDIAFELNSNPAIIETVSDSITYQDSIIYTFSNTGDFSAVGIHNLKVYTLLANDSNLNNDTLSVQILNDTIYQLPYSNDFETVNNGWTASGTNSSWEWGVPNGNVIDTAYSGQNAWVTNLNGNYNNLELSYLTSPCFDFSANNGDPRMNFKLIYETEIRFDGFWMEYSLDDGVNWSKIQNSTATSLNWYNNTNLNFWEGNSNNNWLTVENVLSGLGGEPQVKLRFVFNSDPSTRLEGIGIDNFNIIAPQAFDLGLNEMVYPNNNSMPICGYGANESIILKIENRGANPIDTFYVGYQINNGGNNIDIVISTILPNNSITYNHSITADLSTIGTYNLKTWVSIPNDGYNGNDTLANISVINNQNISVNAIPYSEDFENFSQSSSIGGQHGWSANPVSTSISAFGWRSNSYNTLSSLTGPSNDHTSGHGIYAYLESSAIGTNATMESPCIDLSQEIGANLTFWYHRYGSTMQPTYIDVYDGSSWVNVDVITAQPQNTETDPWTFHETNISAFAGRRVKIRFRGSSQSCCSGDMAIDDIRIEPSTIQIKNLTQLRSCELKDKLGVEVKLYNKSIINVSAGECVFSYIVNGQQTVHDTLKQFLAANDSVNFTFNDSIDLARYGEKINIQVSASYTNYPLADSTNFNFHQPFINKELTENFERYFAGTFDTEIWVKNGNWQIINDTISYNAKLKNKTLNGFQYLQSSSSSMHNDSIESMCLNIREADSLDLVFWYNIIGTVNSKLFVYKKVDDTLEVKIDSVTGTTPAGEWQRKHIDLSSHLDTNLIIGFRFIDTNQNINTSVSLDDIQLLEQNSTYDLQINKMNIPIAGCDFTAKHINALVENVGLDSIPANSAEIYYQIDQNTPIKDTIRQTIQAGEVYLHNFSTLANFNQIGNSYNLRLWTSLNGDVLNENDTLNSSFTNHFKNDSLFEDFESFTDYACLSTFKDEFKNGWYSPNNTWGLHNANNCSPYPLSGPFYDHTTSNGKFIYVEPTNNSNKVAQIYSPCIDVSNVVSPVLSYWFHLYGSHIDTFWVEVNSNGQWQVIDSLIGQQQTYAGAAWQQRSIQLSNFKSNSPLQFRFRSRINGRFNRLALDDISIADSLVTSLNQIKSTNLNYHLYPNPSQGQFTLEVDQIYLGETYQIRELSGKLVQEGKINSNKNHIQLNDKAKGVYFLSVPNKNVREKVVVY